MHESKRVVGTGFLLVLAACSSQSTSRLSRGSSGTGAAPATGSAATSTSASGASSPGKTTLFRFEGSVDVTAKTMALTFFTPSGDLQRQITLPYGQNPGEVYFHTCTTPTYTVSGGGGALSATVSAVNNYGEAVNDFSVSIPASTIVPTGAAVFTTSLLSNDYGTVNNGASSACATWTFTQTTTEDFYFQGTAEGTPASMTSECTGTASLFASVGTAEAVTTDGANVYWSDLQSNTIYRRAVGGTGATTFATGVGAADLAIDGTNLYATDIDTGDVYAIPLASSLPAPLGTALSVNGGFGVAAIGSAIYDSNGATTIEKTSIGMTSGSPFITAATNAYGLGSFNSLLYVADNGVPAIDVYDTSGTLQSGDTIPLSDAPQDVTADATGVYWTAGTNVLELKGGASTPITLAAGSQPVGIAVDSKCVYYADNGTASYMVVAKQ